METPEILDRMQQAMSSQDASQVAECFAEDYYCEFPLHPSRTFVGNDQVRKNWAGLFERVPDHEAHLLRWAPAPGAEAGIWSEWEMVGTTLDGAAHRAGGVAILTVEGDRVAAARFYLDAAGD